MAQYDDVAREYALRIAPKYLPVAQLVVDRAQVPAGGGTIVELAIGTGLVASLMLPRVAPRTSYVGIDLAKEMLSLARRSLPPGVTFAAADVRALPLASGCADLVLSSLGPVQDSDDALGEAARVLRPDAPIALATWGPSYGELDLLQSVRTRLDAGSYDVATPERLRERAEAAGFVDVDVEVVRMDVVHDSLEDYLAYRAAFGRIPWLTDAIERDFPRVLRDEAARYMDDRRRVCLDWSFSLVTARRS